MKKLSTNSTMKTHIKIQHEALCHGLITAGLLISAVLLQGPAWADPEPPTAIPPDCGRSLAQWQQTYWRWAYGGLTLPTDPNGNAEVDGVVLMPLPNASG